MNEEVPRWFSVSAWILGGLACVGYVLAVRLLGPMLEWISTHWFLFGFIGLAILLAAGRLDLGLGLAWLFRDDPERRPWFGSTFWSSFGITLLILEAWMVIFMYEYISGFEVVGDVPGLDAILPRKNWAALENPFTLFRFFGVTATPFLLLLLLAGAFPTVVEGMPRRTFGHVWSDGWRYLGGIAVGILLALLVWVIGAWLMGLANRYLPDSLSFWSSWMLKVFKTAALREEFLSREIVVQINATLMIFLLLLAGVTATLCLIRSRLTPGLMVANHLCLYVTLYFMIVTLKDVCQLPFVAIFVLCVLVGNSGAFKYRFPGMGSMLAGGPYYEGRNVERLTSGSVDRSMRYRHSSRIGREPLDAWKAQARAGARAGPGRNWCWSASRAERTGRGSGRGWSSTGCRR